MTALHALRPAVGGIVRNPILLLVTALYGLFQLPNLLVQSTSPVLASAISLVTFGAMVLVLPFFQGGLLGMADEAVVGETRLGTLAAVGKANYVPLLLGYFVLLAVNMVFGFIAFMGALIVVIGGAVAGVGGDGAAAGLDAPALGFDPTLLVVVAVVAVVFVLAYLLVTFFVQFYAHAVVLDDTELVDGFRRSAGLVRSNLLSTFGYTVLLLLGSLLVGTLAAAASFAIGPQPPGSPIADLIPFDPSTGVIVAGAIGYVVLIGAAGAFYATYSVAFYRRISGTVAN
ncbi:DUF7847 domain-containing protein [Halorubrum lipolyticum]|uniref:DUF7847 domain-containing protein n=1 Tax=Halorubrum lipolyticum DSM 21995 TaxID=1227482 RepID=M0P2M8_9EURY|nr:hypothetical protein [Halorubrum lipolyticum]EMA63035.1 hypothetical protein C469_03405 [Halorubrum lipolyticum DSM 21995]